MDNEYLNYLQWMVAKCLEEEYKALSDDDLDRALAARDCFSVIAHLKGISYTAIGAFYDNKTIH